MLELHTGTFVQARSLLREATAIARGRLLIRALTELASVCYLLDDRAGMTAAAEQAETEADITDPEQSMLAAYLMGAALVFAGHHEQAAPLISRALEMLETEPMLREDPRHLSVALLCARWLLDPNYVVGGLTMVQIGLRRIAAARELGALGALALGLSPAAAGLAWIGDHLQAYAFAGEAVELLDVLGYAVEPGVAHETLARECAARGRYRESAELLRRAEDVMHRSGLGSLQPHLAHAMISCALSQGALSRVVTLGEEELREHAGAGVMLEPLGVAPPLVEAYVGLGRTNDARLLAQRYEAVNIRLTSSLCHRERRPLPRTRRGRSRRSNCCIRARYHRPAARRRPSRDWSNPAAVRHAAEANGCADRSPGATSQSGRGLCGHRLPSLEGPRGG